MKKMKIIFLASTILFLSFTVNAARLVIIAGQSNADGRAAMSDLPSQYQGTFNKVKMWNGSGFVSLNADSLNNNQYPNKSNQWGAEMSFLVELAAATGDTVYCVKYAIGSTCLAKKTTAIDWSTSSTGEYFDGIVSHINTAKSAIPGSYTLDGVFWYQGECDGVSVTDARAYKINITSFYSTLKTRISEPNLKFFITRIKNVTPHGSALYSETVRFYQLRWALSDVNAYSVSVDSLGVQSDYTHLSAQGYIDLGIKYKNAVFVVPSDVYISSIDAFTGTTVDTTFKWTLVNPNSITSQNDSLIYANNHSVYYNFFTNKITSQALARDGIVVMQFNFTWTAITNPGVTAGGMIRFNDTNYASILCSPLNSNKNNYRVRSKVAGVITDVETSVPKGIDVKIVHNITSSTTSYYYWNGSAWSLISTKTGNNLGSGDYNTVFTTNDNTVNVGGDYMKFDNMYMSLKDYSTHFPN